MGFIENIDFNKFPMQDNEIKGRITKVIFHYKTDRQPIEGLILRDDLEEPHRTIILLRDGRIVLGDECQYTFDKTCGYITLLEFVTKHNIK